MMPGGKIVVGIDEVGRGCLAGPLVAAAVILAAPIIGLDDSKKLNKSQRQRLAKEIYNNALAVGIGWTDVSDINRYKLTFAVSNAMRLALSKINIFFDEIIIDGNFNYLKDQKNVTTIVKADQTVPSVSAASIVAKVYRDEWMNKLAKKFPKYGFDKHVGYGTKQHLEMLELYGPCELHRLFYKPLIKFGY